MIPLIIIFGLLGLGIVLVAYGTVAKNKWGINWDPVSCPRCKTPLPRLREARSLQQAMWGGWTCQTCGAGVDKWGREIQPVAPSSIAIPEGQMRAVLKKRIILAAPVGFCLFLLLDWTGITDGGFPSDWAEALVQVVANILWTVIFTVSFYFAWPYLLGRFFLKASGRDPGRGQQPEQDRKA